MTTLTNTKECVTHTPNKNAISTIYGMCFDEQFTFCEECEQNITRFSIDDPDRLPTWSKWKVGK